MVQIYQNEELNDIMFQVEALDEWKAIAEDLGMDNQLGFVRSAESPLPYPWMNTSMKIIFETLCPKKVDYKSYDKTPMPLEVLKQISLSVKDKHFQEIQIWYDDKTPDPAVVGINKNYYAYDKRYNRLKGADGKDMLFETELAAREYAEVTGFDVSGVNPHETKHYLLARWADVVRPLNELKALAKERLIEKYGIDLKQEVEKKTQALKNLSDNIVSFINGEISESQLKGDSRW
jgi:hypothetical protein